MLRAERFEDALALVNANPYGNGTAIFTNDGGIARRFHSEVEVGMVGVNVPIPVPMAFYSFGGWKDSLFGDAHVHGSHGIDFYTRAKAVTARWPGVRGRSQHELPEVIFSFSQDRPEGARLALRVLLEDCFVEQSSKAGGRPCKKTM